MFSGDSFPALKLQMPLELWFRGDLWYYGMAKDDQWPVAKLAYLLSPLVNISQFLLETHTSHYECDSLIFFKLAP